MPRPDRQRSGAAALYRRAANRIARHLSVLTRAANAIGTLVVLALVVIINIDVIARNLFAEPMRGAYEMVQFLMVMIVFLQLPDVVRINRLTRSDGFLAILADRRPEIARIFARIIDLASMVFLGLSFTGRNGLRCPCSRHELNTPSSPLRRKYNSVIPKIRMNSAHATADAYPIWNSWKAFW